MTRTFDVWCAVSSDGYLYGATLDPDGAARRHWAQYYDGDQNQDEWNVLQLKDVPLDFARKLCKHGTTEQEHADGYAAWHEARRYWPDAD